MLQDGILGSEPVFELRKWRRLVNCAHCDSKCIAVGSTPQHCLAACTGYIQPTCVCAGLQDHSVRIIGIPDGETAHVLRGGDGSVQVRVGDRLGISRVLWIALIGVVIGGDACRGSFDRWLRQWPDHSMGNRAAQSGAREKYTLDHTHNAALG